MYCENCGNRLAASARFCTQCGTAVGTAAGAPMPPGIPVPAPPTPTVFAAPPPPPAPPAPRGFAPPPWGAAPPAAAAGMLPPEMHWAIVLILSAFTFGLGAIVWAFREALFVKKLDPGSRGVLFLALATVALLVQAALQLMISGVGSVDVAYVMVGVIALLNIVIAALGLVAVFGMRASLVRHYNTVEPIGLRLSGVMTFFFSVLYFQYHFSRISAWKKTGILK